MMKWTYWFGWMTFRSAFRSLFGLRLVHGERLLTEGPVLVAANHQSFLDPPLVAALYDDEMYFLARKTLFTAITRWLYSKWNAIPIDQHRPDMASLKSIIRKLKDGHRVVVFPEGERTRDGKLGNAAPGIGLVAAKAAVPIQPIRIFGARDALPRGSARIRLARITVVVGEPIHLTNDGGAAARGKDDYERIATRIMDAIAALQEGCR